METMHKQDILSQGGDLFTYHHVLGGGRREGRRGGGEEGRRGEAISPMIVPTCLCLTGKAFEVVS